MIKFHVFQSLRSSISYIYFSMFNLFPFYFILLIKMWNSSLELFIHLFLLYIYIYQYETLRFLYFYSCIKFFLFVSICFSLFQHYFSHFVPIDGYSVFCPCGSVARLQCKNCLTRGYCSLQCQADDSADHEKVCDEGNKTQIQRDGSKRMSRVFSWPVHISHNGHDQHNGTHHT